jgi:hypothetical protein
MERWAQPAQPPFSRPIAQKVNPPSPERGLICLASEIGHEVSNCRSLRPSVVASLLVSI